MNNNFYRITFYIICGIFIILIAYYIQENGAGKTFSKGDYVKIRGQENCNCLVDEVQFKTMDVVCTDDFGKTSELNVDANNVQLCAEKLE